MVYPREGDDLGRPVAPRELESGGGGGGGSGRQVRESAVNRESGGVRGGAPEGDLTRTLQLAFAPIHKRAFGVAVGVASALVVMAVTLFHLLLDPASGYSLRLLGQFFYGYSLSWTGVVIGGFWGFVTGFVMGWFAAFCRNLAIAISVFITRTRAELAETRDFLDHI